jgi:peptidoglycan/LPS O-acetylase OafA/YrhL
MQQSSGSLDAQGSPQRVQQHLPALDGLRGLTAFLVMLAHCVYVFVDTTAPRGAEARLLTAFYRAAHPAVILFFSLSGFVLYRAYLRNTQMKFGSYAVRRLFRIYPAMIVAVAAAFLVHWLQAPKPTPGIGVWSTDLWAFPTEIGLLFRPLLLTSISPADIAIDPVIWSLAIELRFSLLLLPLALFCRKRPMLFLVAAALVGLIGEILTRRLNVVAPLGGTVLGAVSMTLLYLPSFCFGLYASHLVSSPCWSRVRLGFWWQTAAVMAALVLGKLINNDIAWGAASALILLAVSAGPGLQAPLASPVGQFLGRVSYSLYLIHLPIVLALLYATFAASGVWPALTLAPVLSIALAWLMYKFVEIPGIQLGKRVAEILAARRALTRPTPVVRGEVR